jgi:hypothetical protein
MHEGEEGGQREITLEEREEEGKGFRSGNRRGMRRNSRERTSGEDEQQQTLDEDRELDEEAVKAARRRAGRRQSRERTSGGASRRRRMRGRGRTSGGNSRYLSAEKRRQARLRFVDEPEVPEEPALKKEASERHWADVSTRRTGGATRQAEASLEQGQHEYTQEGDDKVEKQDQERAGKSGAGEEKTREVKQLEKLLEEITEDLAEDRQPLLEKEKLDERNTLRQEQQESRQDTDYEDDDDDDDNGDDDDDYSNDADVVDDDEDEVEVFDNVDEDDDDNMDEVGDDANTDVTEGQRRSSASVERGRQGLSSQSKALQARWRADFRSLENSGNVHSGGLSRRRRRKNNSGVKRRRHHRNQFQSSQRMRSRYGALNEELEEH